MTFLGTAPDRADLAGVRYLFTDIDDTLTTGGKLLPQTYQALWDLDAVGIAVVPVTGGSAGWCEHIVRTWPVAAAIAESGAIAMTQQNGRVSFEFWDSEQVQRQRQAEHLAAIMARLDRHGGFRLAHDQPFRLADVAIDIAGHAHERIDALAAEIRLGGASAAISSIHINTWIGDYDKRAMSGRVLQVLSGLSLAEAGDAVCFVGDSRNDASMFSAVRNSFGVSNIVPFLKELPKAPRWLSAQPAGLGFSDIARALVSANM
jgi:HAD superfamily hydrolase (TIGR01484 family)